MTNYTIEIKSIKKGWSCQTVIALFDSSKQAEIEQEIKSEMQAYGPIAIRCRVEHDGQPATYILPN